MLGAVATFPVAEKVLIAFALEPLLPVAEQTLGVGVAVGQGVTSICQMGFNIGHVI